MRRAPGRARFAAHRRDGNHRDRGMLRDHAPSTSAG
jgi:hypothetical protein